MGEPVAKACEFTVGGEAVRPPRMRFTLRSLPIAIAAVAIAISGTPLGFEDASAVQVLRNRCSATQAN